MSDPADSGFFRRWSSRKAQARQGPVPEADASVDEATPSPTPPAPPRLTPSSGALPAAAPAPTIEDVSQLTPESDFSAFVQREVPVEVKNAAMKKLFADPHFNLMDGLDVYIDDYSQPDPLSPALLRQMASAQFMNLVQESPPRSPALPADDVSTDTLPNTLPDTAAACAPRRPSPESVHHDHADLRLQPDPSPGSQDTGSTPA